MFVVSLSDLVIVSLTLITLPISDSVVRGLDSPTNVQVLGVSSTSLRVTWDDAQSAATYYRVLYHDVQDPASTDEMDVTARQVVITDLCCFCEYAIRVVAFGINGSATNSSQVVTGRTLSDVPSAAPLNVTVDVISSTAMLVSWLPPPARSRNGLITGYKIRYKPRGEKTPSDSIETDGDSLSREIAGLDRSTEYSVRVQAMTVNGTGPPTPWISAETFAHDLDETKVPGKPTSLRVRPLSTSFVASWTPPAEQDIIIRGYVLGYGVGIPDVYRQIVPPHQRYYAVKSLLTSSQYVVSLTAFNNVGEGVPIYETTVTRDDSLQRLAALMPPVGVDAVVLSATSLLVSWSDPGPAGSRVYIVRCGLRGRYRYVNVTSTTARLDQLRPHSDYECSVRLSRGQRHSTWSMTVLVTTDQAAPSTSPRDVTPAVVHDDPAAVTLSWQPPRHSNGPLTGYVVYYTTDATRRHTDWIIYAVSSDHLSTTIRDLRPQTTYYFKLSAHNTAGRGPLSPTVIFHTARLDGTGGGVIQTPDDQLQHTHSDLWRFMSTPLSHETVSEGDAAGDSLVVWLVMGATGGLLVVLVVGLVAVIVRCQRRLKHHRQSGKDLCKQYGRRVNPPDLWIHGPVADADKMTNDDDDDDGRHTAHSDRLVNWVTSSSSDNVDTSLSRRHTPLPYHQPHYSTASAMNFVGQMPNRPGKSRNSFKTSLPTAAAVIFSRRPVTPSAHVYTTDSCTVDEDVNGEELKSEIAGLEGLMRDLSEITGRQLDA